MQIDKRLVRDVVARMLILDIMIEFLILGKERKGVNKTSALDLCRVHFSLFWNWFREYAGK